MRIKDFAGTINFYFAFISIRSQRGIDSIALYKIIVAVEFNYGKLGQVVIQRVEKITEGVSIHAIIPVIQPYRCRRPV